MVDRWMLAGMVVACLAEGLVAEDKLPKAPVDPVAAIREHAAEAPAVKSPTQRNGTKQAMLIAMLQRPEGASIAEVVEATGWMGHTARGAISGVLKKKLALPVTAGKVDGRGTVYRIDKVSTR